MLDFTSQIFFSPLHLLLLTEIQDYLYTLKPGKGFFQVFAGFNGTKEELGISSTNMRLYKSNNMDEV